MNDPGQMKPMQAMRLIFEYEGDQVRLVSQHPVEMAITGFDLPQIDHPAYYVDTRNAEDQTLARVIAHNAFTGSAEVFPEQPGEPILRVDLEKPRGAFTVVVPVPENADHVTLVRVAPEIPGERRPSLRAARPEIEGPGVTDLASFPLSTNRPPRRR
jgi:hypothetical protein